MSFVDYFGSKICTSCRRWLEREAFPPNPALRGGLHSWCRECAVEATRQWRAANPDYVAAYNAGRREGPFPKTCSVCGCEFLARRRRSIRCPDCQAKHLRERKR